MSTWSRVSCDRVFADGSGTCAAHSLPARTVEEARRRADADGWLLGRDRDLCPSCAGTRR